MTNRAYNVLFVCTGNSSRSVLAEAIMNQLGQGKFKAWSAGSHPTGSINPYTIETLRRLNLPTEGYSSKNWEIFTRPGAPVFDFVFTVCDSAAGEVCPVWPGQPFTAHWGVEDPAAVPDTDFERKRRAFVDAARILRRRIELLMALPVDKLDRLAIQREVDDIGTRLAEPKSINVLILCTHNSARSVLAECMLNHLAERFRVDVRAYSAGSTPSGRVNPMALHVLNEAGVDTSYVRSKSWEEFSKPDAPHMRIVITVCDQAAAETCPFWPGAPVQAHWGYPDPSRVEGTEEERQRAFELTRQALAYKITQLLFLPLDVMDDQDLRRMLQTISES